MKSWIFKFHSEKVFAPSFFFRKKKEFPHPNSFRKKASAPFFFKKKSLRPLFFLKKIIRPPCRWSRPGYPINFDPSLKLDCCVTNFCSVILIKSEIIEAISLFPMFPHRRLYRELILINFRKLSGRACRKFEIF